MKNQLYFNEKPIIEQLDLRSYFPQPTKKDAEQVLDAIRSLHSQKNGWHEVKNWLEETDEGYVVNIRYIKYKD